MRVNKGFSVLELVIASCIITVALSTVTTTFLTLYQSTQKKFLLNQLTIEANHLIQLIKTDLRRAGHSTDNVLHLSDSIAAPINIDMEKSCLSYLYEADNMIAIRSLYLDNNKNLKLYAIKVNQLPASLSLCNNGEDLFNHDLFTLDAFLMSLTPLTQAEKKTQKVTIDFSLSTQDASYTTTKSFNVVLRNNYS